MEISAKYDPSKSEDRWYSYWMEKGFFRSKPDEREAYTIVIPPPNVTGVLHMGHMLTIHCRMYWFAGARMKGYNTCWVPGTDHASIATEAKVVAKLKSEGIDEIANAKSFLNMLGNGRKARWNYSGAAEKTWCIVRLGQDCVHNGQKQPIQLLRCLLVYTMRADIQRTSNG